MLSGKHCPLDPGRHTVTYELTLWRFCSFLLRNSKFKIKDLTLRCKGLN